MGNGQSKSTSCYKKGKGCCLIINSKLAKSREKEGATATGSNNNEKNIRKTFQSRDFEVKTLTDCTATEIMDAIQKLPSRCNSYFIFFLCPGYEDGVYDKNGVCLSFEDIHSAANCPSFSDKPRILLFPTCQMREELTNKEIDVDFLFAFNSRLHSPSHRDEHGSCYIEQLLSVIEDRDSEDFESMLDSMGNQRDNMPSYLSSLEHKFYFVARRKQRRSRQVVVGDAKQKETQQDPVMSSTPLCKHNEDGADLVPGVTRDSHTGLPKAAVKRSLSVESSSTNSTNSSHMFSINNEVSPAQSPLSFESSTMPTGSQPEQEAESEERDEGCTSPIQAPVQAEENDEAKTSSPVSYSSNISGENYLTIPETVESDDGVVNIVYSPKVVREEVLTDDKMKRVEEWVNLSIYEKEDS